MSMNKIQSNRHWLIAGLSGVAILLLVLIYQAPIWWVSLKAPNYPAQSFPDAVGIHFHMNGVFNGCTLQAKREIVEDKALDCVHEMDAINHFVGMFPIASGGVVEKFFAPFLLAFLAFLIIGFAIRSTRLRMAVAAGFAAITAWMSLAFFTTGGIRYQSGGYLDAMVVSLGQGQEEQGEELSPIIAALKKSLVESGASAVEDRAALRKSVENAAGESKLGEALARLHQGMDQQKQGGAPKSLKQILATAAQSRLSGKALDIEILKETFEADQRGKPAGERAVWKGSGAQVVAWHHEKSLGRWFNEPERNRPIAAAMSRVAHGLYLGDYSWHAGDAVHRPQPRPASLAADRGADPAAGVLHHRVCRLAVVVRP